MENEENTVDTNDMEKQGDESGKVEETKDSKSQEDYRAKLNATNRFLEKQGFVFKDGKWNPPEIKKQEESPKDSDALSTTDIYTLVSAKIPQEDLDVVKKTAKILGVSISEALKDSDLQTILKGRAEKRKVADATNTKTVRAGAKTVSDEEIVKAASRGEIPKAGSEEAEKLFWARRGGKKV